MADNFFELILNTFLHCQGFGMGYGSRHRRSGRDSPGVILGIIPVIIGNEPLCYDVRSSFVQLHSRYIAR